MCLVTNLRYMLMGAALSQKIAPDTSRLHRLLMACCITDEVFGISIAHRGYTPPAYTYSAALISTVFWASGCAAGIVAGGMLPVSVVSALSVALYGMFLAIVMTAMSCWLSRPVSSRAVSVLWLPWCVSGVPARAL